MPLRPLAVRLSAFGRIDAGEPDPVLPMRCVENRNRVAVGDSDDFAEELSSRGRIAQRQQEEDINQR